MDTSFLDLELATPPAQVTAFTVPAGAEQREGQAEQLLQAADRGRRSPQPPASLAGLDRRAVEGAPRSVGVYGRGVTLLAVGVLPDRAAAGLRAELSRAPGAVVDPLGIRIAAGPLGLMIVDGPDGAVLLTGTVTLDALATAATELTGRAG
jgi:hypothetical protein